MLIVRTTKDDPIVYGSKFYEMYVDGVLEKVSYEEEDPIAKARVNELIECLVENHSIKGKVPKVRYD